MAAQTQIMMDILPKMTLGLLKMELTYSLRMKLNGQIGMKMDLEITMVIFLGVIEMRIGQANTINMQETKMHALHYLETHGKTTF